MYYVYILQSLKDYGFYTGYTSDLEKRLKQHNSGRTQSLKRRTPLQIIYKEEFLMRIDAMKREREIKKYRSGSRFHKLIEEFKIVQK